MDKKTCSDGQKFDILVRACVSSSHQTRAEAAPLTDPTLLVLSPVRGPGPRSDRDGSTPPGPSPALCATVVLLTVGSVLALAVWLLIYRRQSRLGRRLPEEPEPTQEPLQKSLPPAAEAPPPCPHLYPCTGSTWEEGVAACGGPPAPVCRLPLPATELGGTALVTTKTV